MVRNDRQEFCLSPLPVVKSNHARNKSSRMSVYERPPTAIVSLKQSSTEENRRLLLENDMLDAHGKGLRTCRLWQLLLILNVTIILITVILVILLLFIIGPLSPYQTYGQSCRTAPCNVAQGLFCSTNSICECPSPRFYWSFNQTGCRICPSDWSFLNGKCIFKSTFYLNWTDAFAYCTSFTAQLLTLSPAELYPSLTLAEISSLVTPNTNYFIGLSEQPINSGNWKWVDGSFLSSSSINLFCANGTINQFDSRLRTYMNCGIYRMDSCLARSTCQRVDMNFMCEKV
ncbi:unnamed protein product [Adineta ricciae]|uniref:C-type lectin domain-containing protein n=1 Tax=Adineta ricciae TaxID=249248 RepID=A0A814EY04_ADIRI|nr:unnamed protein product [Adineta ricciae]